VLLINRREVGGCGVDSSPVGNGIYLSRKRFEDGKEMTRQIAGHTKRRGRGADLRTSKKNKGVWGKSPLPYMFLLNHNVNKLQLTGFC